MFQRTDRTLAELREMFGPWLAADVTRGKRVVDVACGGGTAVRQLQAEDKTATVVGVDLHLDERQRGDREHFVCADALSLPWPDGQIHVMISLQGPLQYYGWEQPGHEATWWSILREANRVLAPRGLFLFNAITPFVDKRLERAAEVGFEIFQVRPGSYVARKL